MPDPISWAYSWPYYLAFLAAGYLIGSIPFGVVLTRLFRLGDLRRIGSGNIGATNVLRTGRKDIAAATLLLDGAKGAVAVLLGMAHGGPDMAVTAGMGAMLGHLFPVWLGFRGGKGVATGFGVLFGLAWPVGLLCCFTWLATAALFRYSSLAALVTFAAAPAYAMALASPQVFELSLALAVLIWLCHISNLRRLFAGEETRIRLRR